MNEELPHSSVLPEQVTEPLETAARDRQLQAASAALARAATVDDVCTVIVTQVVDALGGSASAVCLLDGDPAELSIRTSRGYTSEVVRMLGRFPITAAVPAAEAVRTGKPLFVAALDEQIARFPSLRKYIQEYGASAMLAIPLCGLSGVLGAVTIRFRGSHRLGEADRMLAQVIADLCGQALERALLYERESHARAHAEAAEALARSQAARLRVLDEASRALSEATHDLAALLQTLTRHLAQVPGDGALVSLVSEDGRWLEPVALHHSNPELHAHYTRAAFGRRLPADQGLTGRVLQSGEALFAPQLTRDTLLDQVMPETRSELEQSPPAGLIIVPLSARGRHVGALNLSREDPARPYTLDDLRLVEELADRAALAIDSAQAHAREKAARQVAEDNAERLARIQRITAALATAVTGEDIARVFVNEAIPALGGAAGGLQLLDRNTDELVVVQGTGYSATYADSYQRVPMATRLPATDCMRERMPVFWSNHAELLDRYPALPPDVGMQGYSAGALLPLLAADGTRALGVVTIRYTQPRSWSGDERALVTTIATLVAQATERAGFYEEEHHARRMRERDLARTRMLAEASRMFAEEAHQEPKVLAERLAERVLALLADGCNVRVVSEDGQWLETLAWSQRDPMLMEVVGDAVYRPHRFGEGLMGLVMRTGEPFLATWEELLRHADLNAWPELARLQLSSMAAVPMRAGSRWIGVVIGARNVHHPEFFNDEDLQLLQELADRAALAIVAAQEHARVRIERERYRTLVQATAQIVWTSTPDGMTVEESPSWCAFTGQSHEQYKGAGWLDAVHDQDRARAWAAWMHAVEQPGLYEQEYRIRRHDGVYVACVTRAAPVASPDGTIREWIGTTTDISVQKQAEETLRESSRRKDEFLAVLGHELRNPLAPITTALYLMGLRGDSATERERAVIERQVKHVIRLVDDLLDISRITQGKIELKRQAVEVAVVLAQAIEMASPLLEQRSHHLSVDVPREGLRIHADPVRFAQILSNLVANAAKYTPPGGRIEVTAKRRGTEVVIAVKDSGIGIPAEALGRLWEPFYQVERTVERAQGGLGLGLSLVHSLVELHGGRVHASSHGANQGSEFVVIVPALDVSRVPMLAGAAVQPARGGLEPALARRVLIVDDNADAADSLADALRAVGHEVAVAYDPPQALLVARKFLFDVALLDIGLPVMDGHELARRLREQADGRAIRFVAVTGYGQDHDSKRSQAEGFEAHFTKPIYLDQILGVLAAAPA